MVPAPIICSGTLVEAPGGMATNCSFVPNAAARAGSGWTAGGAVAGAVVAGAAVTGGGIAGSVPVPGEGGPGGATGGFEFGTGRLAAAGARQPGEWGAGLV